MLQCVGRVFGAVIPSVLLVVTLTMALSSAARAESPSSIIEKYEFRKGVEEKAAHIADTLIYVLVTLHKAGIQFPNLDPKDLQLPNPSKVTAVVASSFVKDREFRRSYRAWGKLLGGAILADFDSLEEAEYLILSRDRFSQALLASPGFWKRVNDVSHREKFDFRPQLRREIRAAQFAGNGVFMGGMTLLGAGSVWGLAKFGVVSARAAKIGVATVTTGTGVWAAYNNPDDGTPGADGEGQSVDTVAQANEFERRRIVLGVAGQIFESVPSIGIPAAPADVQLLKDRNAGLLTALKKKEADLKRYYEKLTSDALPIKLMNDDLQKRSTVQDALVLLLTVIAAS